MLRKGAEQWLRGEDNFYFAHGDIQVLTQLAKNLAEYTSNYTEALHFVEMTMKMKKKWVTPLKIKATVLLKMGKVDEAEKVIDSALNMREFCGGYIEKGNIMKERGNLGEAERYYRRALEMDGQNVEAQIHLGHALAYNLEGKDKRFQEAEKL